MVSIVIKRKEKKESSIPNSEPIKNTGPLSLLDSKVLKLVSPERVVS
jgi:hypothetical protein